MNNTIDVDKLNEKVINLKTQEETRARVEQYNEAIEKAGLKGFFFGQNSIANGQRPEPTGIVLNYDIETVKKELNKG